jgi:ABC-type transport system involved in cytochrome c biogenesis permease subunit
MLTALLMFSTVDALTLVFDGRYRALQAALMGATAFGLCMARLSGRAPPLVAAQGAMALALGLAAPVLLVLEGAANQQAVGLAAAWLVMAACLLWRPQRRPLSGPAGP